MCINAAWRCGNAVAEALVPDGEGQGDRGAAGMGIWIREGRVSESVRKRKCRKCRLQLLGVEVAIAYFC